MHTTDIRLYFHQPGQRIQEVQVQSQNKVSFISSHEPKISVNKCSKTFKYLNSFGLSIKVHYNGYLMRMAQ